jgi:hypothetical protein
MKKLLAIAVLAATSSAFAADYLSVSVDNVEGRKGASDSTAQYIRAGKGFGDYQLGLQARTAKFTNGALASSVETTIAKNSINLAGITPFIGVGHDNGSATAQTYNYGLLGANYIVKAGPGDLLLGVKTRVGSTETSNRTKQTLSYATYSYPVAKNVAVDFNVSHSQQTIKEDAVGLGVKFNF